MFSLGGFSPIEWYLSWIAIAYAAGVVFSRRYGLLAGATFFWIAFSGLRMFASPGVPFPHDEEIWNASFQGDAAASLASIALCLFAISVFETKNWIAVFNWLAVANAVTIFACKFFYIEPTGLLANPSMSGCLSAALLPLFFHRESRLNLLWMLLVHASVFVSAQSQPIGLFFVPIGLRLIQKRCWKTLGAAVIASFIVGVLIAGHDLFDSNGRMTVWKLAFPFWWKTANPFLGIGLGSFWHVGPWLTLHRFWQPFLWLHSDWLQVLFESGILGLALVTSLFCQAVYFAKNNTVLCISLLTYGAWAIANFPLHNPISALLGVFLMHESLGKAQAKKNILRPNFEE